MRVPRDRRLEFAPIVQSENDTFDPAAMLRELLGFLLQFSARHEQRSNISKRPDISRVAATERLDRLRYRQVERGTGSNRHGRYASSPRRHRKHRDASEPCASRDGASKILAGAFATSIMKR